MRHHTFGFWLITAAIVAICASAVACGSGSPRGSSSSKAPSGTTGNVASENSTLQSSVTDPQALTARDQAAAPSSAPPASADANAPNGAAGAGSSPALPSQLDRKMIVVATVNVTIDDVARGFEDVGNVAALEGGFVSSSGFGHNGDRQTASVTIRVPVDKYQDALNRILKLGDVRDEQQNSSDVTEEYTDLQSRLRNLNATEETYLRFLDRAGDIGQVLTVQDRINATRAEIEQVQGRINLVQHQTDLATITAHLDPPPVKADDTRKAGGDQNPLEVAADSFQTSLVVLTGAATVALAVVAFGWWILPVAALAWFVARRQHQSRTL